jgi:hypothetical protein
VFSVILGAGGGPPPPPKGPETDASCWALDTNSIFGASKLKDSSMNLLKPALSPLSATIRLLPTTTMSIVRIDLTFLSFKASNDSRKISWIFI